MTSQGTAAVSPGSRGRGVPPPGDPGDAPEKEVSERMVPGEVENRVERSGAAPPAAGEAGPAPAGAQAGAPTGGMSPAATWKELKESLDGRNINRENPLKKK